jgi:hypothetical protein
VLTITGKCLDSKSHQVNMVKTGTPRSNLVACFRVPSLDYVIMIQTEPYDATLYDELLGVISTYICHFTGFLHTRPSETPEHEAI